MPSAQQLRFIAFVTLLGLICMVFFDVYLHHLGIKTTFLPQNIFMPGAHGFFLDFFDIYGYANPYIGHFAVYPPATYLIIYPFLKIWPAELSFIIYTIFIYSYIFWYLIFCTKSFHNKFVGLERYTIILILMFLTSPMIICLIHGNFESLLFLFLSLFFFAFAKEKYALSSIFLGIAIAFKLYPAVFLVLFIKNKCYKECIYCVIFVVILTIAALFTFPEGLIKSTNMWLNAFVEINKIMAFSHDFYHTNTLFFLVQIAVYLYSIIRGHSTEAQYTSHLNHSVIYYYILAILMFTFLAFFTLKYEKTYWKQVTVLFFCGMLFPTISVEYKLIILFIPIFLFIKQSVIDKHQSIIFNKIYLLLFSLLLIPKNYLIFNFYLDEKIPIISGISPLFNIFIMLFFIFLIIYERIKIIQIEKTSH